MKKFSCILLVVLMAISCMTMAVFASEDDIYYVNFTVSDNPGFASYNAEIIYDDTVLELVSITEGALASTGIFNGNVNTALVGFMSIKDVTENGILFTAGFKLKDAAVAGQTYSVTANLDKLATSNAADDYVVFTIVGGSITVPVPECKHEHTKIINEKAATCTEDGYTGDTYCEDCKTTIAYGKAIDKLGHTWDEGKVTKEATCTEYGEMTYTCACGETKTEPIPATGHTWDEGKVTKDPTCTEAGEMTYTCACGETKTEPIDATGHKYTGKVTKEPTCTEDGEMTYTCEGCGDSYTVKIETDGHHYQDGKCLDCGAEDPNYSEKDDSNLDDVPKTGDITPMLTGAAVVLVLLGGTAAVVTKRKFSR